MDGTLRDGTTAGDLMLAHSQGMQPQDFFQLAHDQPLLGQLVFSSSHWSQSPLLTALPFQSHADQRSELYL